MQRILVSGLMFASLTAAASMDAPLHEILAAAGVDNPLREDLQRPIDPRLTRIEADGIEGSGLFPGDVYRVRNAKEFQALSEELRPGDQVVLTGSDWADTREIRFRAHGTEQLPILIRAESPGSVVFTGTSSVVFSGEHLVIMNLEFKDIPVTKSGTVIFRLGNGKAQPASHCIVNRVRIENCNSPLPGDWPVVRMWYMTVTGPGNTVANSTFEDLRNFGQMLAAQELPERELLQLHILNNQFLKRPMVDRQNGYELIQIGWSGELAKPAGSLIQGNRVEGFQVENEEIFTLKASDIFVRGNTFTDCQGSLNLRSAARVLLQRNVFDGVGRPNTGGIRMEGGGHVVIENIFRNLKKPRDYYAWALSLMAADVEEAGDTPDGYGRAKNILISDNRFEHCDARIAVGTYPRPNYPLLPRNIVVRNNVFDGSDADSPFDYVAPDPTGRLQQELHVSGNTFVP
jgi:poly(beta-D-mannuronate) lyase